MVRGKFFIQKVAAVSWSDTAKEITFSAIYDTTTEENQKYSKSTPSGQITMLVDNPPATDFLKLGGYFYVDFTEAPRA